MGGGDGPNAVSLVLMFKDELFAVIFRWNHSFESDPKHFDVPPTSGILTHPFYSQDRHILFSDVSLAFFILLFHYLIQITTAGAIVTAPVIDLVLSGESKRGLCRGKQVGSLQREGRKSRGFMQTILSEPKNPERASSSEKYQHVDLELPIKLEIARIERHLHLVGITSEGVQVDAYSSKDGIILIPSPRFRR